MKKRTYLSRLSGLGLVVSWWLSMADSAQAVVVGNSKLSVLDNDILKGFNPIKSGTGMIGDGSNVGMIVDVVLTIIYGLATVVLTVMLVWGGIEIMMAGMTGKANSAENGKKRVIAAIIGFLITFGSFLILQLIQALLGLKIQGLS